MHNAKCKITFRVVKFLFIFVSISRLTAVSRRANCPGVTPGSSFGVSCLPAAVLSSSVKKVPKDTA